MKNILFHFCSFFLLFLVSCSSEPGYYSIEGNIDTKDGLKVYRIIANSNNQPQIVDSTTIEKNKFLMEFTIKKILQDELVDDIYISTDDNETAKVGKSFGAKCPFIRPKNLANKSTDLISVAKHTLKKIEEKLIFLMMQEKQLKMLM